MTKYRIIIIHFSKLYALETRSGSEQRKHGIVLKATAVECVNKGAPKPNPCEALIYDSEYVWSLFTYSVYIGLDGVAKLPDAVIQHISAFMCRPTFDVIRSRIDRN